MKFSNFLLITILAITSTACGGHTPALKIEDRYSPYVKAFEARAAMVGQNIVVNDLTIQSVPSIDDPSIIAVCAKTPDNSTVPLITVSQEWWPKLDVYSRENVIFHEMGHCVLNRGHRSDGNNGLALSIMNPYIFGGSGYTTNYLHYIHELFAQADSEVGMPLKFYNNSPAYASYVDSLFNPYPTKSASSKIKDADAPEKTMLSQEELSHLNCGDK